MNGYIFVELFSSDLDKKMTSASYNRERNKNKVAPCKADNSIVVNLVSFVTYRLKKAYPLIILALEASNWSRIIHIANGGLAYRPDVTPIFCHAVGRRGE